MDRYLKSTSLRFIFDDTYIRLGESPAHNYRELARKMPEAFLSSDKSICDSVEGMESFNEIYFDYCRWLGEIAYRYKDGKATNLKILQQRCPPCSQKIYHSFENSFKKNRYGKLWLKLKTFSIRRKEFFKKIVLGARTVRKVSYIFYAYSLPFMNLNMKNFSRTSSKLIYKGEGSLNKRPSENGFFTRASLGAWA